MIEIHHVENDRTLRHAYDEIYSDQGILHSDSFYRWILGLIRPEAGKRLLDIATGQGRLPYCAARQGLEAHGIDISARALLIGQDESTHLVVANGQKLPYSDASFDYLTNIGSLEHYVDPGEGVREMVRVLAPHGVACTFLPNTFSLLANVLYAWHNGRTSDDGQPIQRYAARYEWRDFLEAGGLEVTRTVKWECEPVRSLRDFWSKLRRPKDLIRWLLTPFLPINLANSFVFICRNKRHQIS